MKTKTEKVGLYARVSTTDKGQDVDLQLTDLRTYANARGWSIYQEYIDEGVSGSKDNRPALNKLMEDARKRKIDTVVVWRLDRFGRSLKHLINTLDELRELGIGFLSFKESLDLTNSTGRLMFHLLASFAEFERELIRERVVSGIQNARNKGKSIGRPTMVNDDLLKKVRDMRDRGMTCRGIANTLGVSKSLVHKTLLNSVGKTE